MPTDTTARTQQLQPGAPDGTECHAFCAALSESARGLAFLPKYARRRNADARQLLTAIERLQLSLATNPAAPAEVLVKQKLRALHQHGVACIVHVS